MDVARACKRLRPEMSNKTEFESKENIFLRLSKFKSQMQRLQLKIIYSTRYSDTEFEYRHAFLPIELSKMIPSNHLLTESEWRNLGVQQSVGWEHYMLHNPEPHILLFRRKCPKTNRGRN